MSILGIPITTILILVAIGFFKEFMILWDRREWKAKEKRRIEKFQRQRHKYDY